MNKSRFNVGLRITSLILCLVMIGFASRSHVMAAEEESVSSAYNAIIQYGHPALITDNEGALKTYIRYPQSGGFADGTIAEWARIAHVNAKLTAGSSEGELNVQFDSYLSPNGAFAGVIEQGTLTTAGMAHSQDITKTFNLDLRNEVLLNNSDILDFSRVPEILELLLTRAAEIWPESAGFAVAADERWLDNIAIGPYGVVVVIERGACLPAVYGSLRVNLPYDRLGDLLLIDVKTVLPEESPETAQTETEMPTESPIAAIDPSKPMIALTFDDGPSRYTPQILDLLEQYGGRATFCVIGNLVESGKDTVKRAADMGCEIVGHSWDHKDLTKLSADAVKAELADTNGAIKSVTGVSPNIYRPPYGAINSNLKSVSSEMGLGILYWSVDTLDWKTRNADSVYKAVMNGAADRAIVLNHDLYKSTADAMARIIPELIEQGYQLVTVSELLECSGVSVEAGKVYSKGN